MSTTTTFVVCMTNKSVEHFDTAEAAVNFAASRLYVDPDHKAAAIDSLNSGRLAEWAYGFNDVTIFPPGVSIR